VVERITITGRIVDDDKEALRMMLEHANPRVPLDAECVIGDKWATMFEFDYAALERRMLEELR